MKVSLSEISTVGATFEQDLAAYRAAGFDAIGIWETKLDGDMRRFVDAFLASGLAASNCVPAVPTILPTPIMEGPKDPELRILHICDSLRRLSAFRPASVLCITGPVGDRDPAEARSIVVEGLRRISDEALRCGIRLGLEPIHVSQANELSFVHTIPDALELIGETALAKEELGIMADTYHLWDTPDVLEQLAANADRITGLHVGDWPAEPGRTDRVLPGEGISRTKELVDALRAAGWDGFVDVEIFSTPDRFWGLPVDEAARRAHAAATALLA